MISGRELLSVRGAQVVRDGRVILDIDEFVVREGEHLALLGPNGAGKSTLIGLLTRDVLPLWADPYPVLFLGNPRIELAEARKLLGVVSSSWQENVRVRLTVREVVLGGRFGALGIPPHLRHTVTAEDASAADAAIAELGMSALADRVMTTLSTGEARRALIARALVHDPAVLVLDEPCAGLDPTAAWQLRDTMRRLAEGGRTLVLVTHHIEDVVRQIDRAVLMREARIVADGPKREVLTGEALGELFGVPIELEERSGEYRMW
ncbi:MAG TPA: ATP-binding cassette domain-containing protein [Coriobacteriia bacterium]|nr:ATP-binding cassette domain-containing protein [Coriobacteriia bacterium]